MKLRREEWITIALLPIAIGLMRAAGIPFGVKLVWSGIVSAYGQAAWLLWLASPIALTVLHLRGRMTNRETTPLTLANLWELARCNLTFIGCIFIYSNLKAALPRLNPFLFDAEMLRADTMIFFGHPPNQFLPSLRPDWLVRVMDEAYNSFFLFFPATMGLAFFLADRRALRTFVAGYVLCFYVGTALYYLAPSLGAVFTHAEWYVGMPPTRSALIRDTLMREYRRVLADPSHYRVKAFLGIGAFPSLHVAHVAVALTVARRHFPLALWIFAPVAAVMTLSTMYFGWHYFIDLLGAIVVAWIALGLLTVQSRSWAAALARVRTAWRRRPSG
jgi:membrane-associated phospholipid phosphatase